MSKGMWYVFDKSEYVYSKVEMIFILLAPLMVSLLCLIGLLLSGLLLLNILLLFISMLNILGMLGGWKQKGDILYSVEIILDKKNTFYKFGKEAKLQKFVTEKRQA
jgi:hypothetical protein